MSEDLEKKDVEELDQDELLAQLKARFKAADDYRKPKEARDLEGHKLYVGYRNMGDLETQEQHDASQGSALNLPLVYKVSDTLRSRWLEALCMSRPYIDFGPKPSVAMDEAALQLATENAKLAGAQVDTQLEDNKAYLKFYEFFTDICKSPLAIMGVGWRYETTTEMVETPVMETRIQRAPNPIDPNGPLVDIPIQAPTGQVMQVPVERAIWDDNELTNIDFLDFWPDPRGSADPDSWRFCFHRERLSREEIEQRLSFLEDRGEGTVFDFDFDEISESDEDEGTVMRQKELGASISSETDFGEDMKRYNVYHYWEDRKYAMIINMEVLAYYGKNPYKHQKKPFIIASLEPIPREPIGLSVAMILEDYAHELNTSENQLIDAISLIINRMFKVRKGCGLTDADFIARNGAVLWVDDLRDVEPIAFQPIDSSIFLHRSNIERDAQDTLATTDVAMGGAEKPNTTATEIMNRNTAASIRFKAKILLFEMLGFRRLAYLMDENNKQFLKGSRMVKYYDETGVMNWRQVDDSHRQGEHEYRPAAATIDPSANKEVRRAQLMQLLEIALKTQNPYLNVAAISRELLLTFDLKNPNALLRTEEEIQQQQMIQADQMEGRRMQQMEAERQAMREKLEADLVKALVPEIIRALAKGGSNEAA